MSQNRLIEEKRVNPAEDTIDLAALFSHLMNKWYLLLLVLLVGMLLGNMYAFFMLKPTYESTSKLYVVSSSGDSAVDLTDLNIGTSLTNDYRELIMSYPVLEKAMDELNLKMPLESFERMITLTNPTNTRVLSITAKSNNPELSKRIANTVAGVAQEYLPETMSTVRPNVAQVAKAADRKSSPSFTKYTAIGGLLFLVIAVAIETGLWLVDDTVHTQEDWDESFGTPLIVSIPENDAMRENKQKSAHKASTRRIK